MGEDAYLDPEYARLYDWTWRDYDVDVPFYVELAHQHGMPVLVAGCGTGRLVIALARSGVEVVGFDHSTAMLDVAFAKLEQEPHEMRDRARLCQADLTDFDLGREFPCVLLPNASAFHLPGRVAVTRCFRSVFAHTMPGGVAVVDVLSPERMVDQDLGHQVLVREGVNPDTGRMTRELKRVDGVSWDTQTLRVEHAFVEGDGDEAQTSTFVQQYRWLERDEGVSQLVRAGFPEVRAFGDFEQGPYTEGSPRLILAARRLERDVF